MRRTLLLASLLMVPALASSQDFNLETPTGNLSGTLELPEGEGPFPVALFLPASGSVDRDGNRLLVAARGKNEAIKQIAQGLAEQGIASVRYDKRGLAGSQPASIPPDKLTYQTYVDDGKAWAEKLADDERFSELYLIGYDEGALNAALVAQEVDAAGVVALAPIPVPAADFTKKQISNAPGMQPEQVAKIQEIIDTLAKGEQVNDLEAPYSQLFPPQGQPYLISWFKYQPGAEFAKLESPVLVIYPEFDKAFTPAEVEALAEAAPEGEFVEVSGMNHYLKESTDEQTAQAKTLIDPSVPVPAPLIEALAKFAKGE